MTNVVDVPPRDVVVELLGMMERDIHREGWDARSRLFELHWDGRTLAATPVPNFPIANPLGGFLAYIAEHMTAPSKLGLELAATHASDPRFFGLGLVAEAWANDQLTDEQARDRTRALADIVGSVEARFVNAVDIRGRTYWLERIRGEKPAERHYDDLTGRVPAALRDMVASIAALLPEPNHADLAALRALHFPNADEIARRAAAARS